LREYTYLDAHNVLVADVVAPTLILRLVLDAGPDEDAFIVGGVAATALNIDNPDEVDGSGARTTTSAHSQQMNKDWAVLV
jgi:hypothetical protein